MNDSTLLPVQGDVIAVPFEEELAAVWRVKLVQVHEALGVMVAEVEHIMDIWQVRQVVYRLRRQ